MESAAPGPPLTLPVACGTYPTLLQAERYVCSIPRDRYSLLGHRAALVLAGDAEAGDSFASFLKGASEVQEVRLAGPATGRHKPLVCGDCLNPVTA